MRTSTRSVIGILVVIFSLLFLSMTPAQGDPGGVKPPSGPATQVDPDLGPDRGGGPVATPSPAATRALAAIQSRIAAHVARHGTAYTFGSYLDADTGRIVIETSAPAAVVSALVDLPGAAPEESQAARSALVRTVRIDDAWHRRDDVPSFYGGAGLSDGSARCSSGYAVRNSSGTVLMVTAGHCYANGTTVRTESLNNVYGTVSNRRLASINNDGRDMELIGGRSYAPRVFTGGVTSTSSIPVVSAGPAVVGFSNYCHSGRTTGEQCGHRATSVTAQVCTATGCKTNVIAYTGGTIQQGGDSGGPFYAKDGSGAWIRGHVIASSSTTGYVETWTKVRDAYGVSIMTG